MRPVLTSYFHPQMPSWLGTHAERLGNYLIALARTLGVVETTVFPDLEGLPRELRREWG